VVRFSYRAYPHYPWLFVLAGLALAFLGAWPSRRRWLPLLRAQLARLRARRVPAPPQP